MDEDDDFAVLPDDTYKFYNFRRTQLNPNQVVFSMTVTLYLLVG